MSLTSHEQRQLEQIEAVLTAETPGLHRFLARAPMGERRRARIRKGWLAVAIGFAALGTALLALGVVTGIAALAGIGVPLGTFAPLAARFGPALHNRPHPRLRRAGR